MPFLDTLFNWFNAGSNDGSGNDFTSSHIEMGCINPASGLPMTGEGCAGVDLAGNPFGTDLASHDVCSPTFFSSGSDAFSMADTSDPFASCNVTGNDPFSDF